MNNKESIQKLLNKTIEDEEFIINAIANSSSTDTLPLPENALESAESLKIKKTLEIKEESKNFSKSLDIGLGSIIQALNDQDKSDEADDIIDWFEEHLDRMANITPEEIEKESFGKIMNFPLSYLFLMHQAITHLIDLEKYEEAQGALTFCLLLNATIPEIWFTNGVVLQKMNKHEEAIYAFGIADALNTKEDPYIYAHMARSLMTFKLWQEAEEFLVKAVNLCQENDAELLVYSQNLIKFCEAPKQRME